MMTFTVDLNSIYQTANHYICTQYNKVIHWTRSQGHYAYSRWPAIQALAQQQAYNSWQVGKAFLWKHRAWMIGSTMAGIAYLIIQYIRKNTPQYPRAKMESTLHVAELDIEIPEEVHAPPNVTLTFCIDTSRSMAKDERIGAVKRALKRVMDNAQEAVDSLDGTKIAITIVGFDDVPRVITDITKLIPSNHQRGKNINTQSVKKQIQDLQCEGKTSILEGLNGAIRQLKKMAKADKQASHTVILLTDGEDNINQKKLLSIHQAFASTSAQLFAIGIGSGHNKIALQQIAGSEKSGFKGVYIDTTQDNPTIETAIETIYQQAISSFQSLELTTSHLPAGTWSIGKQLSVSKKGKSICRLEPLSEGDTLKVYIKIHSSKLASSLDLSTVKFDLTFIDPKGRKGKISLPWNPNAYINPRILLEAKSK